MTITAPGGTLVSLNVADATGRTCDVVLGYDDVEGYEAEANHYLGSTIGHVANRIADGHAPDSLHHPDWPSVLIDPVEPHFTRH